MRPTKIISGAQTGADQGGLEAAIRLAIEPGGTVPNGRMTEAGPLTDEQMILYKLKEHRSPDYAPRTLQNVFDSDGTLIMGNVTGGTRLTISYCRLFRKPYIIGPTVVQFRAWLDWANIKTLNVAGNRESKNPGIYKRTKDLLVEALDEAD